MGSSFWSETTSSTVKSIARRLGLLLFGILLSLATIEGILQAGALVIRWAVPGRASTPLGSDLRVVVLGDSNSYGLYVERSEAYPSVFEAEWNRYPDLPAVQVINLGFPGTNSSRVRNIVGPVLRELEPTAVIVMIGANDFWTVPEPPVDPAVEGEDERGSVARTLWRVSRVYRLLFMLRQAMSARTVEVDWTSSAALPSHPGEPVPDSARGSARVGEVDIELGWKKLPESSEGNPTFAATLRQNLTKIVAEIRRSGAEPILLTYPSSLGIYTLPSRVIRETADALGCELVDLAVVFAYLCPGTECAYFFPDGHPTAAGHAHIGRILARKLRDVRKQRHDEAAKE